jgi:hypothetical protein
MVDNWTRLGLVQVNYTTFLGGEQSCEWVEGRPEFIECRSKYETESKKVIFQRGILERTALGQQFAAASGLA